MKKNNFQIQNFKKIYWFHNIYFDEKNEDDNKCSYKIRPFVVIKKNGNDFIALALTSKKSKHYLEIFPNKSWIKNKFFYLDKNSLKTERPSEKLTNEQTKQIKIFVQKLKDMI